MKEVCNENGELGGVGFLVEVRPTTKVSLSLSQ